MSDTAPVVMGTGAPFVGHVVARPHVGEHAAADLPGAAPVWLRVGDVEISEVEVAREMLHHRAANPHVSREAAVQALVVRQLLRLEASRLGLTIAEPRPGETPEEAAIRVLLEREIDVHAPDEASCRRYFEQNCDRLHTPERRRVRHILLAAPLEDRGARLRARTSGEQLIGELATHPERFAELALRHSACPSRMNGGDLGWIERGDTTPELDRQLFMLELGLAGCTLESRYGHHVARIDAVVRGAPLAFVHAQPRIAAYLETQARQHAIHEYLGKLRSRFGVARMMRPVSLSDLAPAKDP